MPSLSFVLPHWMYWGTLILFPGIAWYLVDRQRRRGVPRGPSLFLAYLFWLTGGMLGLHRFYLRSAWGFIFVPVFLSILYVNVDIRDAREDVSRTRAALEQVRREVGRFTPSTGVTLTPEAAQALEKAKTNEATARTEFDAMQAQLQGRYSLAHWLAILLAAMLIVDAILLPTTVRQQKARAAGEHREFATVNAPDVPPAGTREDPTLGLHTRVTDAIEWVNVNVGRYVAYWAVISVFVYYYEVIARFAFNSPTNWVHESMFLMYGMQYMLCGAFAYREDQHVRVDVFYSNFSARGKAIADIITSVFFFIFILTMLWTGTKFAMDAIGNSEVSFTEWGVQYWPVKLTIPIGATLMAMQGLSKLIKDIVFVATRARA